MNAKEAELVTEEYCKSLDNYNICAGGKGGFGYINANCKEQTANNRKKAVARRMELLATDVVWKQQLTEAARLGYKTGLGARSEEQISKDAAYARSCRKTLVNSPETRRKISESKRGTGLGNQHRSQPVMCDGQIFSSMEKAALALNIFPQSVSYRIKTGRYQRI